MRRWLVILLGVSAASLTSTAVAAGAAATFMTREQPLKTRWTFETLARSFPNDPNRCVAFSFGEWDRVKYAISYSVTFDPSPAGAALGSRPVSGTLTDNAWFQTPGPGGKLVQRRNGRPPNGLDTPLGPVTWNANVARLLLGSYSTGRGCEEATRPLLPFTASRAVATLSIPVRWVKPDEDFDEDGFRIPKGAVMRVVEVDTGVLYRTRDNKTTRIRFGDYLKVGDIISVSKGGAAAIEMITGGRIGIVGDSAFLILSENQVKNLSQGRIDKALTTAERAWRKVSERKPAADISTSPPGAIGIKG